MPTPAFSRVLTVLLVAALACQDSQRRPVELLLAERGAASVDGAPAIVPPTPENGSRDIVQSGPQTLGLYVWLPEKSRLVVEFQRDVAPDAFALSVHDEHGGAPVALERTENDGEWHAALARFDGRLVRLDLQNRGPGGLRWIRPRIVGVAAPASPPLDLPKPPRAPVNVLVYVIDALRADRLSLYGYARPTSPNLEKLARRSTVFRHAYAAASHTIPAVAALLWSQYPSGVVRATGAAEPTLTEIFRAAGYRTAAFVANPLLRPGRYGRGFDEYRVVYGKDPKRPANAPELHAPLLAWLGTRNHEPFFVYVQSMDVHFPYLPPASFRERFAKEAPNLEGHPRAAEIGKLLAALAPMSPDLYDASIAYADHELGALIDQIEAMGIGERTLIVVTADHGEPLGQHGYLLHGRSLHEESVRVPLLLRAPWDGRARDVASIVSHLDIAPTLVGLAGLSVPAHFRGADLLAPQIEPGERVALGEQLDLQSQATTSWFVRAGPWKLIGGTRNPELFDLRTDPKEKHNVTAEQAFETSYLHTVAMGRLPGFAISTPPPALDDGLTESEHRELQDALRALGYIK